MRIVLLSVLSSIFVILSVRGESGGLVFDRLVYDFKIMSEDDAPIKMIFKYTNQSSKPIVITRISVACGCTAPTYSKEPILPNHSGEVAVMFYPKGQAGDVSRNVYLFTNLSNESATEIIKVVGVVTKTSDKFSAYSYFMGNLRLKQRSVEFSDLRVGQRRKLHIQVANSGNYELKLSAQNLPHYMSFTSDPEVIKPDSVADIILTIDTNLLDTTTIIRRDIYISGVGFLAPSGRAIKVRGNVVD